MLNDHNCGFCSRKPLLLPLLLGSTLALFASAVAEGQNCSTPVPPTPIVDVASDIITVPTSLTIADSMVDVDIAHEFVGDLRLTLISPATTSAVLIDGTGAGSDNLLLTFANVGDPLGTPSLTAGNAQTPQDPTALLAFNGEDTAGDWTLDILDSFVTSGNGALNMWCLTFSDVPPILPPTDLICTTAPGSGAADLSWTNFSTYTQIEILVDGISVGLAGGTDVTASVVVPVGGDHQICLVASTGAGPLPQTCCTLNTDIPVVTGLTCTDVGDAVEATWVVGSSYDAIEVRVDGALTATLLGSDVFFSTGSLPQGTYQVCVRGLIGLNASADVCCSATIITPADAEACSAPLAPIQAALPPTVDVITMVDNIAIGDLQVLVDIALPFQGDINAEVQSPGGTTMPLWAQAGGANVDLEVIFDTNGVPNASINANCAFCFMQPAPNPLALIDALGESTLGDWTLTVTTAVDPGTLEEWCVRAFLTGGPFPVSDLTCTTGINNSYDLSWSNNGSYSEIGVYENGLQVATLLGTDVSYTGMLAAAGPATICVEAIESGGGALTQACCDIVGILAPPVDNLVCTPGSDNTYDMTWTNPAAYSDFNIFENGVLVATIAGGSATYSGTAAASGFVTVCVEPLFGGVPVEQTCCTFEAVGAPPVVGVSCNISGLDGVDVSWTNAAIYSEINVYQNGLLVATQLGTSVSYSVAGLPTPQSYEFCIEPVSSGGLPGPQACCVATLIGVAPDVCLTPTGVINLATPTVTEVFNSVTDVILSDLTVTVDVTHGFVGDLQVTLESPSTTSVLLHDNLGGAALDLVVGWNDGGIPNAPPYNAGTIMQPSPGFLSDFANEPSLGDWTMTFNDTFPDTGDGVVNGGCLYFVGGGCPTLAVNDLACATDGFDTTLTWTNADTYTSIDVLRDGLNIATIGGAVQTYVDVAPGSGTFSYSLELTANGCTVPSDNGCSIFLAGAATDLIWAHPDTAAGLINDAAAVQAALTTAGIQSAIVDELPTNLSAFDRVWALVGSFPDQRDMSPAEGQTLRDYCAVDGGNVYISGADIWGFSALTIFDEVDGVDGLTVSLTGDGDLGCPSNPMDVDGLDSGIGCDLSAFPNIPLSQDECNFLDELTLDEGASTWTGFHTLDATDYIYGSAQDGATSLLVPGSYRVLTSCFEFGGLDAAQQQGVMDEYLAFFGGVVPPVEPDFLRADVNNDGGVVGLLDGLFILNWAFNGGPTPPCFVAADVNGDNAVVGLLDGLYILNWAFNGGPQPPAPFPACGANVVAVQTLGCLNPTCP